MCIEEEDLNSFDIKSNMDKENTLENLKNIAKNLPLGFIYITKNYSKIEKWRNLKKRWSKY